MKEYYEDALQMIKLLNIELTKEEYNKLAQNFILLCSDSLEYIAGKSFDRIILDNIA